MLGQAATMFVSFPTVVASQFSTHSLAFAPEEVGTFTCSSAAIFGGGFFCLAIRVGIPRIFASHTSGFFICRPCEVASQSRGHTRGWGFQDLFRRQASTMGGYRRRRYLACFSQSSSHCCSIVCNTRAHAFSSRYPICVIDSAKGDGMGVVSRVGLADWNVRRLAGGNGETVLVEWPGS
jgi:hypothetical protein